MKKILVSAAALGLVAGVATGASALELKTTGLYSLDGFHINQGGGAAGGGGVLPWTDKSAGGSVEDDMWFEHQMKINADLIVNDKITMKSEIRFISESTVWGTQDDIATADGGNMEVWRLWMVYESPVGKFEIGRRPAGAWGLDFVNSSGRADRIYWALPMPKPFNAYVFFQKNMEQEAYYGLSNGATQFDAGDVDNDYYEAAFGYKTDTINAQLGYAKTLNNSADFNTMTTTTTTNPVTGLSTTAVTTTYGKSVDSNRAKGFGTFKVGPATLLGEFDYKFGEEESTKGVTTDIEAWAYFVGAQAKFGNLTATMAYAHIDGEDTDATTKTAYDTTMGMGKDFEPLYILTGSAANILNGDRGANTVGTAVRTAGADAIVALADFKVSEPLTLHAGIGFGLADDTEQLAKNLKVTGIDDEYGWEIDLGVAYEIYKNLTYEVRFGYWMVGDFAKLGSANKETEDVMQLSHHLTMKF